MQKHACVERAANSILAMLPDTLSEPNAWRGVLANCAVQADLGQCMVTLRDKNLDLLLDDEFWLSRFFHGYDAQVMIPYCEEIQEYDTWIEYEKLALSGGSSFASNSHLGKVSSTSPFFDWLKFAEFNDTAVSKLTDIGDDKVLFNFHFNQGSVDQERISHLLNLISKPLGNVFKAGMYSCADNSALSVLSYAENYAKPVFLLDYDAKMLEANDMAIDLLTTHPAFYKPSGKIALSHPIRTQELKAKINDTINTGAVNYMRIDDGIENESIMAMITPSQCGSSFIGKQRSIALVTITAQSQALPYLEPLAQTHLITKRQMKFLELFANGLTLVEIAHDQNVKAQTVRWAFTEIYKRLGVSNHNELLKFLCQLPKQRD